MVGEDQNNFLVFRIILLSFLSISVQHIVNIPPTSSDPPQNEIHIDGLFMREQKKSISQNGRCDTMTQIFSPSIFCIIRGVCDSMRKNAEWFLQIDDLIK